MVRAMHLLGGPLQPPPEPQRESQPVMKQRANRKRLVLGCMVLVLVTTGFTVLSHPPGPSRAGALAPGVVGSAAPQAPVSASRAKSASASTSLPAAAPASAGMIVAIDPRTGALVRPSPEQIRAATSGPTEALRRTPEGLVEILRSDGAVGLDLQGRFQDYAVAQIGPDGKPVLGCLHADGNLRPTLRDSLPVPPEEEE